MNDEGIYNETAEADVDEEAWKSLLRESVEGKISATELMRRSLPFFSFGQELVDKDLSSL